MNLSRRKLFLAAGTGALAGMTARGQVARAQGHEGHTPEQQPPPSNESQPSATPPASAPSRARGSVPVRTLNGWTLPYRLVNGVKEFHLVAEEFEHEFAPGCRAKCWGYNGEIPNTTGVDQSGLEEKIRAMLPGYMAMGRYGMAEHQDHIKMGHMQGPPNTLPMMAGTGPYGNLEMGGMFTVVKVRDNLARGDYRDPGWYRNPKGQIARKVSDDPEFGRPVRRGPAPSGPMSMPPSDEGAEMDHSNMNHSDMNRNPKE